MIDHFNLPVSDLARSRAFYAAVLACLDSRPLGRDGDAEGFGSDTWGFGIVYTTAPIAPLHVGFRASSRAAVDAFFRAALEQGAVSNGDPGLRPDYDPDYYAAYVLDPDGHRIEAVCRQPEARLHILRIDSVTVDAAHPTGLARFWAAALPGYAVRVYDATETARLAALGLTPETDPVVMVDGPGPTLCFQRMPGQTAGRNRWHVDLRGGTVPDEVARLQRLGATVREVRDGWTTLLDPEGNPFCVIEPA
ncbi:MAG: hypothetical protein KF911_11550 [Pseudomonadales bacterium]|nr:hypothetical protein [Pseudomonadales bacterium]